MVLNQRLKQFLEIKNLSRNEFAEVIKLHPTSVSKWTNMEQEFPIKHIIVLCEEFPDLNVRWFLTGTGPILQTEQNNNPTIANDPTSPYKTECTNPVCAERIKNLSDTVEDLRADKKWLQEELRRREVPPEKHATGGVAKSRNAG